jgi:hypothetical protein
MVNLALWLKKNRFRLDQVQNFYPSPLASATTMYYTGKNPLAKVDYKSEEVVVPRGDRQRRLHKALLRYHDPANAALIRNALEEMGLKHLIGGGGECLVPAAGADEHHTPRHARPALTRHTDIVGQRTPGQKTPPKAGQKSSPKLGPKTSPKLGQKTPPKAGQTTSLKSGQKTPPKPAQETSPKAGRSRKP